MSTSDRSDITKWSGSNKKSESHSSSSPKRLRSTYLTRNSIDEIEVSSSSSEQNNNSSKTNLLRRPRKNPRPKRHLTAADEIKALQESTELLIPRAPFRRLVRELILNVKHDAYISNTAFEAIQESTELFLTTMFEDTLLMIAHRGGHTLQLKDVQTLIAIKNFTYLK